MKSLNTYAHGLTALLVLSGCSGAVQEPLPASRLDARAPQPESGEWLYATQRAGSGQKAECSAVHDSVIGEKACKQALCAHGARLGADWLRVCKSIQPGEAAEIEQVTNELKGRAARAATACESEGAELIRGGCTQGQACVERAQIWATRCDAEATPLVVRMIEVRLERALGNGTPVRLDARSCETMFADVKKASTCVQQFQCSDSLALVEEFRGRCHHGGATLEHAVAELAIFAGAQRPTEPIALDPASRLTQERHPLALADGTGAVLAVCGEPVRDLAGYLAKRKSCDGNAVTVVRRFPTEGGAEARLGRLQHPGDVLFRLRFPSIVVQGELRARDEAELAHFKLMLDELPRAPGQRGMSTLLKAMNLYLDGVQNSALFEQELKQRDESLAAVFQTLAKEKKAKIVETLAAPRFFAAMNRAERLPLADVSLDGRVVAGESTPAAIVDFAAMLPKATAAYRAVLEPEFAHALKLRAPTKSYGETLEKVAAYARTCAEAEVSYGSCESELLSCGFGVQACDEARLQARTQSCDTARVQAERSHLEARLALDSMPESFRKQGLDAFARSGCRAPWW